MKHCQKCETEYDNESECMCRTYRERMERPEYSLVPERWIRDVWEYGLYCGRCKAEYGFGEDCDCAIYELWIGTKLESKIPGWWPRPR